MNTVFLKRLYYICNLPPWHKWTQELFIFFQRSTDSPCMKKKKVRSSTSIFFFSRLNHVHKRKRKSIILSTLKLFALIQIQIIQVVLFPDWVLTVRFVLNDWKPLMITFLGLMISVRPITPARCTIHAVKSLPSALQMVLMILRLFIYEHLYHETCRYG